MKNKLANVPNGYKAVVHHAWTPEEIAHWCETLGYRPRNGTRYLSIVDIVDTTTGEIMGTGVARCKWTDAPSRKMGRLIAHNRAVDQFHTWYNAVRREIRAA